jgi:peptidoglycan/LPS O-acetylase OafA/YrhL
MEGAVHPAGAHDRHQRKFDVLRGTAAIVVLLSHAVTTFIEPFLGPAHPLVRVSDALARHAVLIFFLLSGYLITRSILANIRRHRTFDAVDYLAARVARIYPPLIGAICVAIGVWTVIHFFGLPGSYPYGRPGDLFTVRETFDLSVKDVASALVMQNGMLGADGPLWTLYFEFHLYLIAMFATLAVAGHRLLWPYLAAAAAILAYYAARDTAFLPFAIVWCMGSIYALRPRDIGRWTRLPTLAAAAALVACGLFLPKAWAVDYPDIWVGYLVQLAACLVYARVVFLDNRFGAFAPAILARTAAFSYSLYVIHFPLLLLSYSLTQAWLAGSLARSVGVAALSSIAVGVLSHYFSAFFEDQRRFKPRIERAFRAILRLTIGRLAEARE